MRICGIDLASQPAATAIAVLEWGRARRITHLSVGADDDAVIAAALDSAKCGIDAPLGWPDAFVDVVAAHHGQRPAALPNSTEPLRLRRTDIWVWRTHGRIPLSVSTDNIGVVALRCVRIQQRIAAVDGPVDRTGGGLLAEVYPAAALKVWGLPHRGYKRGEGAAAVRRSILEGLIARFDLHLPSSHRELASTNDDALDALVSAVVAAYAARGRTSPVPPELREFAGREGWIHVPVPAEGDPGATTST